MFLTSEMIRERIRIDHAYNERDCPESTTMRYGYEGFGYTARLLLDSPEPTCKLMPKKFGLFVTLEEFHIPDNVVGLFFPKSSYSRRGLILAASPLEPGWSGAITMAWHNLSDDPVTLYNHQGIVQVLFWHSSVAPLRQYAGKW